MDNEEVIETLEALKVYIRKAKPEWVQVGVDRALDHAIEIIRAATDDGK